MPPIDPPHPQTARTAPHRTVRVFHNNDFRDAAVFGYQPTPYRIGPQVLPAHTVTEVYRYPAGPRDDTHHADHAFALFNVGDDAALYGAPDSFALDYRDRGNRSLSVGDIVAVQNQHQTRFYACADAGWALLEHPPVIDNREQHGTTPADAPYIPYTIRFTTPSALAQADPWQIEACCVAQVLRRASARLTQALALDPTASYVFVDTDDNVMWQAKQRRTGPGGFRTSWPDTTIATFTTAPQLRPALTHRVRPQDRPRPAGGGDST